MLVRMDSVHYRSMSEEQAKVSADAQELQDELLEDVAGGFRLHQAGVIPPKDGAVSLPLKPTPLTSKSGAIN